LSILYVIPETWPAALFKMVIAEKNFYTIKNYDMY